VSSPHCSFKGACASPSFPHDGKPEPDIAVTLPGATLNVIHRDD
jgi:hypothetical protein